MRHHNQNRKFGRETDQRRALLKSLARSLVLHESIETTEAKAKELRPYIERLVTKGRTATLATRRSMIALLGAEATQKLLSDISPRYASRNGGYTRVTKAGIRRSGGAPLARIMFVK